MKEQAGYSLITEFLVGTEKYCVVRTSGGCSTMTESEYRNLLRIRKQLIRKCA